MEIIERKENILLNRIEIDFSWRHEGVQPLVARNCWTWSRYWSQVLTREL